MTLEEYMNNPQGTSAVFSNKEMYRNMYIDKLNKLLLKENGKFATKFYKSSNSYYIHVKVPSEVVDNFYYDVVFKIQRGSNLGKQPFRVFSNAPSFTFVFTYAFKSHKMLIEDLEEKYDKKVLNEKPKEKNPKLEIGYEKSICIAYLFLKNTNFLNEMYVSTFAVPYNKKQLLREIAHATEVCNNRIVLEQEQKKREKRTTIKKLSNLKDIEPVVSTSNRNSQLQTVRYIGKDGIKQNTIKTSNTSNIKTVNSISNKRNSRINIIKKK